MTGTSGESCSHDHRDPLQGADRPPGRQQVYLYIQRGYLDARPAAPSAAPNTLLLIPASEVEELRQRRQRHGGRLINPRYRRARELAG